MNPRNPHLLLALTVPALGAVALAAWSLPFSPPPAEESPPPPPEKEPTLDDLLGLPKTGPQPAPTEDPTKTELDKELSGAERVRDDFVKAVDLMSRAWRRLGEQQDPGLQTQRLQEEALQRIDKLLDEAKKNRKQSSSQQQQQQQSQDQQSQSSQRQSSQQQQSQEAQGTTGGMPNVPRQGGALKEPGAGTAAAWGSLPERVRAALLQGFSDKYSSTYEQLTREYYQRLAEQQPAPAGNGGNRP